MPAGGAAITRGELRCRGGDRQPPRASREAATASHLPTVSFVSPVTFVIITTWHGTLWQRMAPYGACPANPARFSARLATSASQRRPAPSAFAHSIRPDPSAVAEVQRGE